MSFIQKDPNIQQQPQVLAPAQNKKIILLTTRKIKNTEMLLLSKLSNTTKFNEAHQQKKVCDLLFDVLIIDITKDDQKKWLEHNKQEIDKNDVFHVVLLLSHGVVIDDSTKQAYSVDSIIKDLPKEKQVETKNDLFELLLSNHLPKIQSKWLILAKKLISLFCKS